MGMLVHYYHTYSLKDQQIIDMCIKAYKKRYPSDKIEDEVQIIMDDICETN
jgi:hypothetical protein